MNKQKLAEIGGNTTFGVGIFGLTLNEWVAVITFVYFLVQVIIASPELIATIKGWFSRDKDE